MSDFSEHGLVFYNGDKELDFNEFISTFSAAPIDLLPKAATADGELTTADDWEDGGDVVEGEFDGGEIGEDFEDGAARTGGIIVVLVSVS